MHKTFKKVLFEISDSQFMTTITTCAGYIKFWSWGTQDTFFGKCSANTGQKTLCVQAYCRNIRLVLIFSFRGMKYSYSPLNETLVPHKVTPIKFTSKHLYTYVGRGTMRIVSCLRIQHDDHGQGVNLDTWSGDKYSNISLLLLLCDNQNPKISHACKASDTKYPLAWQKNQWFIYLLHKSGFKSDQHKKSEDAVVPVLIKTP